MHGAKTQDLTSLFLLPLCDVLVLVDRFGSKQLPQVIGNQDNCCNRHEKSLAHIGEQAAGVGVLFTSVLGLC